MAKQTNNQSHKNIDQSRPFLGLRSFEEKNRSQFGGRDEEIKQLFGLVVDNDLTVVYGTSGIGKTSLLKAGLMPKLRQKFYFPIYIRIDFSSTKPPLEQFRELIFETMTELDPDIKPIGQDILWEYLHDVNLLNGLATPVLILDQFEEIFTLGKGKMGIKAFIIELSDLAKNRIPFTIKQKYKQQDKPVPSRYNKQAFRTIISLREDYLARLDELKRYLPSILDDSFRVVQMTITQAMDAAIKPGKGLINEAVAKEIVALLPGVSQADFDLIKEQGDDNTKLKVEPFLLSLICQRLNESRIDNALNTITSDLVAQFDVNDVIESFYNETIQKYDSNVDLAIQKELLDAHGFRKLYALNEFQSSYNISDKDIDALIGARIIRKEHRNNVEYIELIHDVLAPIIKKKREKRIKKEQAEERKATIAAYEAEREATILKEKEAIRKRNKQRAWIIVPSALIIAAWGILSLINVINNNNTATQMNRAQDLLSEAQALYKYDEYQTNDVVTSALLTRAANRSYSKIKYSGLGKNLYDQLYYNSMLVSLKNLHTDQHKNQEGLEFIKILGDPESMNRWADINASKQSKKDIWSLTLSELGEIYFIGLADGSIQNIIKKKGPNNAFIKDEIVIIDGNIYSENSEEFLNYRYDDEMNVRSIAHDGKRNLLATASNETQIYIYDLFEDSLLSSISAPEDVDKYVEFFENGNLCVMTENWVKSYDANFTDEIKWKERKQSHWKHNGKDKHYWDTEEILENSLKFVNWDKDSLMIPSGFEDDDDGKRLWGFSISKDSKMAIAIENGLILLTEHEYLDIGYEEFGKITSIKFNPTGDYLVIGNEKGRVFSLKIVENNGKDERMIKDIEIMSHYLHDSEIKDITFHEDDTLLHENFATADEQGIIVSWKRMDKEWHEISLDPRIIRDVNIKDLNGIRKIVFSQEGDHILAAYGDAQGTLLMWPATVEKLDDLICTQVKALDLKDDKFKESDLKIGPNAYKLLENSDEVDYCCDCDNN